MLAEWSNLLVLVQLTIGQRLAFKCDRGCVRRAPDLRLDQFVNAELRDFWR